MASKQKKETAEESKEELLEVQEPTFTLSELLGSNQFTKTEKDQLPALIGNQESYSVQEAMALIKKNQRRVIE